MLKQACVADWIKSLLQYTYTGLGHIMGFKDVSIMVLHIQENKYLIAMFVTTSKQSYEKDDPKAGCELREGITKEGFVG